MYIVIDILCNAAGSGLWQCAEGSTDVVCGVFMRDNRETERHSSFVHRVYVIRQSVGALKT